MKVSSHFNVEAQVQKECTCPALSELLPDYIVELLEDTAAVEVEDHLLDCLPCREKYLKMLCLNGVRRYVNSECSSETGSTLQGASMSRAKVLRMADFKKRRP